MSLGPERRVSTFLRLSLLRSRCSCGSGISETSDVLAKISPVGAATGRLASIVVVFSDRIPGKGVAAIGFVVDLQSK